MGQLKSNIQIHIRLATVVFASEKTLKAPTEEYYF